MDEKPTVQVRIGSQGRLVLPRVVREQLGAEEGTVYEATVEDGRLILETREALLHRMQREVVDAIDAPRSLVDELLTERRAEAAREPNP